MREIGYPSCPATKGQWAVLQVETMGRTSQHRSLVVVGRYMPTSRKETAGGNRTRVGNKGNGWWGTNGLGNGAGMVVR